MKHEKLDLLKLVGPVIQEAGALLLSYYHKKLTWQEKGYDSGFATEADVASEQFLIKSLKSVLPEAAFIAEESGKQGNAEYCWVIDPLDGTTNFAYQLPYFCISVALTYNNVPVFGMVYQPLLEELFYAQEGKGAWLNNKKITTSTLPFEKSIISIGLPYAKNEQYAFILENTWIIAREAYAIRHFSAAALDLAYVAAGRFGGIFFSDLRWWDVAAGMILIKEAGGMFTDYQGKPIDPAYQSFVGGANRQIYERLHRLVKPVDSV